MDGAEVEVAFGRDVGDVGGDAERMAEGVDLGGGDGVVDCGEDEGVEGGGGGGEVGGGGEGAGDVGYLVGVGGEAVPDFGVQRVWGDEGYVGVGAENGVQAGCGDLGAG